MRRLLREALLVPMILVCSAKAVAQTPGEDQLAYQLKGIFAVPESPAFVLVDDTPDEILRPTTVGELNAAVSRFSNGDSQFSVPRSLGVEFSPGLLLGGKDLTIDDYRKRKFLYRLRLSVATQRPEGQEDASQIAVGLRLTLDDHADLRMNDVYIEEATRITGQMVNTLEAATGRPGADATPGVITNVDIDALNEHLRRLQERESNAEWTKAMTDVAFAVLGTSADSTGKDLKAEAFAGWLSHTRPLGNSGQLLVGGTLRAQRGEDDIYRGEGSTTLRAYLGTNHYKASLGGQIQLGHGDAPVWCAEIGGEAFGANGFWLAFSAGWEFDAGADERSVVSRTSIRYGLPSL